MPVTQVNFAKGIAAAKGGRRWRWGRIWTEREKKMERKIMLNMDMVNGKVEAVGSEGRAAHGSVVGAAIRGWLGPGVIEAGWKVSEILLPWQNLPTLGTPEEPNSLRHKFSRSAATNISFPDLQLSP